MTLIVTAASIFPDDRRILHELSLDDSVDSLLCLHGIACNSCWICKCQRPESRFLTLISVFNYLNQQSNETSH